MPAGRPPTGRYKIKDMVQIIDAYTDKSAFPILKEVCFNNRWDYQYVMNLQAANALLREAIKRLITKKEIVLEKGVQSGQLDRTFSIFTLKQPAHGWTDAPQKEDDTEELSKIAEILVSVRRVAENEKS